MITFSGVNCLSKYLSARLSFLRKQLVLLGVCFFFCLLAPVFAYAWCSGSCDCCPCPSGQAQCKGSHASCEEACGMVKSGGGSSGSPSGMSPQDKLLYDMGTSMLKEGLQRSGENAERERREKAARDAELKRQKDEEAEATKQRLLNGMPGYGSSSELSLKGMDSGSELHLKTGDEAMGSSASSGSSENTGGDRDKNSRRKMMSDAYNKGYADASRCFSQNAGLSCMNASREEGESCLSAYRAGFASGDGERKSLMEEAYQAGLNAGNDPYANGASDPRAVGPCRVQWIESYNRGHFKGEHAKTRR